MELKGRGEGRGGQERKGGGGIGVSRRDTVLE